MIDLKNSRVLCTGGYGFLGKHLLKALESHGVKPEIFHTHEYDLTEYEQTFFAIRDFNPDIIFHLAAVVGGIGANQSRPADFWQYNLDMGSNILKTCHERKVKKLIMIGTVCSYPKIPPSVPFKEEDLFAGYPEETNAPYAIAKRALLVGAQAYRKQYGLNVITLLPTNLYGPGDHFDLETSHVIPALIRKVLKAKEENLPEVTLWGTGQATRCFLYVEDCAEGLVKACIEYNFGEPVNLASQDVISIRSLAENIKQILDYHGEVKWDVTKPDGQPHRALDCTKAERLFGFRAKTNFEYGLRKTIEWYLEVQGE